MRICPTNDELVEKDSAKLIDEDSVFERCRIPRTSEHYEDFLDSDDLPDQDDLLTEAIVPEQVRLQRLKQIQSPFEQEEHEPYTYSCKLAVSQLGVPIALVSLVYDEFQWFKEKVGTDATHTDRCWSFCAHTFTPERAEVLYVPDVLEDHRFVNNHLVHHSPNIRFYCGVPLVTEDGVRLGALCIIDRRPRSMCKNALQFLINLAELTVRELLHADTEKKHKPFSAMMPNSGRRLRRIPTANRMRRNREQWFEKGLTEGVLIIDISMIEWAIVWRNTQWDAWTKGASIKGSSQPDLWSVLQPVMCETSAQMQSSILEGIARSTSHSCSFLARVAGLDGKVSILVSCDVCSATRPIKDITQQICMPSDSIPIPPTAQPITFDADKLLIVFVKLAQESLADDNAIATTANIALSGALRPEGCTGLKKAKSAAVDNSGYTSSVPATPEAPLSPSPPTCPPNRTRAFQRPSHVLRSDA